MNFFITAVVWGAVVAVIIMAHLGKYPGYKPPEQAKTIQITAVRQPAPRPTEEDMKPIICELCAQDQATEIRSPAGEPEIDQSWAYYQGKFYCHRCWELNGKGIINRDGK